MLGVTYMSFCSNCGNSLEADAKFCRNCGAPVAEYQTPPCAPAAPVVVPPVPQVYGDPVVSTKGKVLGFVGMGLSIGGFFFAVLGLLYTFIGMAEEGALAFAFSISFSLFSMPLSIVGNSLSRRSRSMGNNSTPCSVGSKLGIAGIIVSAVMLFFGFIGLMV